MNLSFSLSPINLLIGYLISINLITFLIFAFDKSRSRGEGRRIPEKTLLLLALLGGSPGAAYAMSTFRHKTKKYSFQISFYLIILGQIALLAWIFHTYSTN